MGLRCHLLHWRLFFCVNRTPKISSASQQPGKKTRVEETSHFRTKKDKDKKDYISGMLKVSRKHSRKEGEELSLTTGKGDQNRQTLSWSSPHERRR